VEESEGDWLRVQPIMQIAETIRDLGGDAGQNFSAEGIPDDLFSNPDNLISLETVGRILDRCVATTHCAPAVLDGPGFRRVQDERTTH